MASCDSHQCDCANNQESHQQTIKIDPDGDLTLVVGRNKTRFLVCSKALSRSALFWKRCLYGQFKEAKPAAGQDWVVEFPDDNPSAMECTLLLIHGLGHKMPEINLQLAFEITILTNKYNLTRSLWAVARSWIDDLEPMPPDESDDDTVVPQLQWLWVTKELGGTDEYGKTFSELSQIVSTTGAGDARLILRPYEPGNGTTLTREILDGYDAEKDVICLLADEIRSAREDALSEIQSVLKRDIKTLRDAIRTFDSSNGCNGAAICVGRRYDGPLLRSNERRLCEYAMQAIVAKISTGKDSAVKPIAKIGMSVDDYRVSAICFTSRIEREIDLVCGYDHKTCTPFKSGWPSRKRLKEGVLRTWRALNYEAFEVQARVSGLEKDGDNDNSEDQEATGPQSSVRKRSRDEFEAAASS